MRIRYRTEDPSSIWHDNIVLGHSKDVSQVRMVIVRHCREFFGSQFHRYSLIHVSLHQGTEVMAAFSVVPSELKDSSTVNEPSIVERHSAA